jgi:hypothetical protein
MAATASSFDENGDTTGCWAYYMIHALYASFRGSDFYVLREVSKKDLFLT